MIHMLSTYLRAWVESQRGATAVEYGIMVALIAVVIIAVDCLLGLL
jgi:Flp pilus assembly pilin Flp